MDLLVEKIRYDYFHMFKVMLINYYYYLFTSLQTYMYYGNMQERKSMFKHGGDNIGVKFRFRLRDVSRGAKRATPC